VSGFLGAPLQDQQQCGETCACAAKRAKGPDKRLRDALRRLLEARHVGRENAATWERLAAELEADGVHVTNVRRLQECAAYLRRVERVAIGGTSQAGIWIVGEDSERKLIASERWKRIRAEIDELGAFDRALYERIALALPSTEEAA
jgi:hypothetical protein